MTPSTIFKNRQEEVSREFNEQIASLLIAVSLFNSQISDSGGKTINFKVYEEHLSKEIDQFKSFLLSSTKQTVVSVLKGILEEIGELITEMPISPNERINQIAEYLVEDTNIERQRIRTLIQQSLTLIEK